MKNAKPLMTEDLSDDLFEVVGRRTEDSEKIQRPPLSAFKDSWMRLKKNKGAVLSLVTLTLILLLAIFGPYMNEYKYYETDYSAAYQSPSGEHWLGTDKFGRDQWTRIWEGTRVSLYIAVLAAFLDLLLGVTIGAVSALFGGKVDNALQRFIEILVGIPNLIIIILLIMLMKPGILTITIAMVITGFYE